VDLVAAQHSVRNVGIITFFIGIALVIAPVQAGRLLRLEGHSGALRIIGVSDLALVPGLLVGKRKLRWMVGRAATNLMIAGYCVRLVRRERAVGAGVGVVAMLAATVADSQTIAVLRSAGVGQMSGGTRHRGERASHVFE
jgi:hypothetical protein